MRTLLLTLALLAVAAPAHAATLVTAVAAPTPIREWDGIGVFSVRDGDVYRLAITRGGAAPEFLPVAPRAVAFDADIGPDRNGAAAIVYSRCAAEQIPGRSRRRDCDIYRYSLARNVEAPVRNSDSNSASEIEPTIWRDRIAFARIADGSNGAQPVVYTRTLDGGPSQRLPGLPACRRPDGGACQPTSGEVLETELYGRWLALNVTYTYRDLGGICGQREVRLDTIQGSSRVVTATLCGLSGQSHVGVSFDAGRLYWTRFCPGDPSGCRASGGAWRYALDGGASALAPFRGTFSGFAFIGAGRAYLVPGAEGADWRVELTDPLTFAPARPPR